MLKKSFFCINVNRLKHVKNIIVNVNLISSVVAFGAESTELLFLILGSLVEYCKKHASDKNNIATKVYKILI